MLFDLRSRGRRRTVQVIYLGLAILMMGGLVLFGVGAGNGIGGLLNAFTNNSNSGNSSSAVNQATKSALKATKTDPTSAVDWENLLQAYWSDAQQYQSATTGAYTTAGKRYLADTTGAWQHYLKLVKSPAIDSTILAARAYGAQAQYAQEASTWEYVTLSDPGEAKGFECLAAASFAAKQDRKAQLAEAKAVSMVPKLQQLTLKEDIEAAKTEPAVAAEC